MTEVAAGVYWVRMGLPFALDHINLWVLRDRVEGREGWTVVDCGVDGEATRAHWEQLFSQALEGLPILRVVVTHMHPDHVGLAHWLTQRWSVAGHECRLWMSAGDWSAAHLAMEDSSGFGGAHTAAFYASHGLDPSAAERVKSRGRFYSMLVPAVPTHFRRLHEGMPLNILGRTWRCLTGYGHAPEHISLHCEELGVFISGDMLLPRISTNVSVFDREPEGDPLALFLASLSRMTVLPDDTLVLPSHGRPFLGLHARIAELTAHHRARLEELVDACGVTAHCAADVLQLLFGRRVTDHEITFAMGEAVAHLNALWHQGVLSRQRGEDGVWRYAAVRASS